ncbi:MAG: hypothetical protein ACOX3U_06575 [Christensenellales bacterium]|jgi:hypothetical protein
MMSNYGKHSELAKLIIKESKSYNAISEAIMLHAVSNRRELDFLYDNPNAYIDFYDIDVKYVLNVTIDENIVEFDVIVESFFTYQTQKSRRHDFDDNMGSQWYGLHCIMLITDMLEKFSITRTELFSIEKRKKYPMQLLETLYL